MRNRFDRQLLELNNELIQMGSLIERAIEMGISALVHQDVEKAKKAIEFDSEIDEQEKVIESLCMKLLLQQQPVAKDLRLISAALKMITDMERIGDQAEDIAEIVTFLPRGSHGECARLGEMAAAARRMVTDSVDAYVRRDPDLARQVIRGDDVVDEAFLGVKERLIAMITADPGEGEYALDLLMIAKYLERIGDHATNLAEWVIYAVTGEHKSEEMTQ